MLEKNNVNINFAQGLDLKTDPFQVQVGKFLALENSIFQKGGLLQKRNGFSQLQPLPANQTSTLTTYSSGLVALGSNLQILSEDTGAWISVGAIENIDLSVVPTVRANNGQSSVDIAIASNGLALSTWVNSVGAVPAYQINDSVTGQIIIPVTLLPASAHSPRIFLLGAYFILTFVSTSGGVPQLQYIAIPIAVPGSPGVPTPISTTPLPTLTAAYDAVVFGSTMYFGWNSLAGGQSLKFRAMNAQLSQSSITTLVGEKADLLGMYADSTPTTGVPPRIWVAYWAASVGNVKVVVYDKFLSVVPVLAPTTVDPIGPSLLGALTLTAKASLGTVIYQVQNTYSYSSVRTDFTKAVTCTDAGVAGTPYVVRRSVGIASKAFFSPTTGTPHFLATYNGSFQPTYFLADTAGSSAAPATGNVVAKLAYSNGAGYIATQVLPNITLSSTTASMGYLIADLLVPTSKPQDPNNTQRNIYAQFGINLAKFTFSQTPASSSETAGSLHFTGGYLFQYDGAKPVEHSFHVWPEDVVVTKSPAGGLVESGQHYYSVTYEWTDAQGNLHRSAPSVPFGVTNDTSTSTNTINVPTLRLTAKGAPNSVRIVVYRWGAGQQVYHQITSITSPVLNDATIDSVVIIDTASDASIEANIVLYTTGGVIENIAAPACTVSTLFKTRLFLVDAEDQNLIWYSKQVIENTPVEMSDLFTIFISPTIGSQGSTGAITVLTAMDDRLIIFKRNAIYYVTGNGPDNTGANNDFSEPVFITATVGCTNPRSIVFMPQGIMFQSDKGIWLLGRDLSTTYIGSPVESYNTANVVAALTVPGTNQVRFTLNTGVTLMYDYFFGQWGTFTGISATSSTLYQNLHTFLNSLGAIYQESPGRYLDGSVPVLMKFTTSWLNLAGLQGFERAYEFYFLGTFLTPHRLTAQIAYDYNPSFLQTTTISPDNFNGTYGADPIYGDGTPYGGNSNIEQWRIFLQRQKCQSFQITLTESYDASFGVTAGAGFTMSGLDLTVGMKQGRPKLRASRQVG